MGDEEVPEDVRRLLRECIRSYEGLEALLLLRRGASNRGIDAVARALKVSEDAAEEALTELHRRGLLERRQSAGGPVFRYEPSGADLARAADALAQTYQERPLAVMRLMSENAIARLRDSASRAFADAFILGGGSDEDG